jgi:hypothetical protein
VAGSTAFRWRHRFVRAVTAGAIKLRGILEADETFFLSSRKGERKLDRKARRRGGKASKLGLPHQQVPVLMAADRLCCTNRLEAEFPLTPDGFSLGSRYAVYQEL